MSTSRSLFRFGLLLDTRQLTRSHLLELGHRAESMGVSIVCASDHIGRWANLQLLQIIAETTSLRVGTLVLNNDFRHPLVLAQELATLDQLIGGRLEIGIGAGWDPRDYLSLGVELDRPAVRVERLKATVGILKQALSTGVVHRHADDAYPAMHAEELPLSAQRPHPPILVGGGGRRLLEFAAREADIVGVDQRSLPNGGLDPDDTGVDRAAEKLLWIRRAAGANWRRLNLNVLLNEVVSPASLRLIARAASGLHALAGNVDTMIDQLVERRERFSISYVTFREADLATVEPVIERLAGR